MHLLGGNSAVPKRPVQCAVRYKKFENSWRGALVRTDEASRDPAENKRIVRNGTITIGRIVLFAARSKLQRHEDAIRIVHVIAERFAIAEATDGVELASRLEGSH